MAMHGLPRGVTDPPGPVPVAHGEEGEAAHRLSGTLVLVFVFLAAFVLYYFSNWKLLSLVWKIG